MAAAREYDIVVFGATGFTGRRVAQNLATSSGFKGCAGAAGVRRCRLPSLVPACLSSQTSLDLHHSRSKWAIAGRDRARLDALAASLSASSPGVLVADATDAASLAAMAAAAAVVINTVGPFRLYSQPVVAACVASGTDYLDVCGEPDFIERVELEFDEAARDKGVYVASACGFDSVPGEFAVQVRGGGGGGGGGRRVEMAGRRARACVRARPLATRNTHIHTPSLRSPQYTMSLFRPPARCTSVETALTIHAGPAGFRGHYATFQSAVLGFAGAGELRRLRKEAEQARLQGRGRWHCRGWWMAERGSRPAGPSACSPPLPRLPCRAMPSLPLAPWRRSAARPCSLWCLAPSRRARRVLHGTHASEPTPTLSWCGGRVHGCLTAGATLQSKPCGTPTCLLARPPALPPPIPCRAPTRRWSGAPCAARTGPRTCRSSSRCPRAPLSRCGRALGPRLRGWRSATGGGTCCCGTHASFRTAFSLTRGRVRSRWRAPPSPSPLSARATRRVRERPQAAGMRPARQQSAAPPCLSACTIHPPTPRPLALPTRPLCRRP